MRAKRKPRRHGRKQDVGDILVRAAGAQRAADLVQNLHDLPIIVKRLKARKPASGYDRRVLSLAVEDVSIDGGTAEVYTYLDIDTALRLIPLVRVILIQELRRQGQTR